jgi:hypothetical protein
MVQPALDASDFKIIKGSTQTYTHVSAVSGKEIHINFCSNCGTKLFQTFERFSGAIGLYRGTLDNPNWVEITPENSKHIFVGVGQNETLVPGHTPIFTEHAMLNDGTPVEPEVFEESQKVGDIRHSGA